MWKLQRNHLHCFQLMKNDGNQVLLPVHGFLQSAQSTGIQNKFL